MMPADTTDASPSPSGRHEHRRTRRWILAVAIVTAAAATVVGDGSAGGRRARRDEAARPRTREELQVVDCLLPGQVRKLGRQSTYVSRRRPARISALDCAIRGGEYVAYDRANYQTALRVWMEEAESGDPLAQYYVGEIYEKGLGTAPDYSLAVVWYRKAAESGHAQAQTSLGFLYEKGLGVPQDTRQALEWYRKAAGVSGVIMLDSEVAAIREELASANEQSKVSEARASALEGDLNAARAELEGARSLGKEASTDASRQEQRVAQLERSLAAERRQQAEMKESLRRYDIAGPTIEIVDRSAVRGPNSVSASANPDLVGRVEAPAGLASLSVDGAQQTVEPTGFFHFRPGNRRVTIVAVDLQGKQGQLVYNLDSKAQAPKPSGRNAAKFGPYHALIIGNSDYESLSPVETAARDVSVLADLLARQYGFRVTILKNATDMDILSAFKTSSDTLGEKDNLLIYYAGHGGLDPVTGEGYWLPVNAGKDKDSSWISSREISAQLTQLTAKHVLVIADSCYSGAMTRSSLARFENSGEDERDLWIGSLMARRSRTALTSGGLKPVLDSGGGGHSIFARAVIDTLTKTTEVLDTYRLWSAVKGRVMLETQSLRFEQIPEYAPIHHAGHESGEFFFVPARG